MYTVAVDSSQDPYIKLENRREYADRAYEPRKKFVVLVLVL
jgi:hypothetical protein